MKRVHTTTAIASAIALCNAALAQISLQPATSVPVQGHRPDSVAFGDFDRDGDRDMAISTGQLQGVNGPEWVEFFTNNGAGAFSAGQVVFVGNNVGTAAVVAADFDGDGDVDVAVSLHNTNAVQVLLNTAGTFSLGANVPVGASDPRYMAAADLDGDGDIDLVTSNRSSNNLRVLLNSSNATFTSGALLAVGSGPRRLALADLDGNGVLDIAVAAHDSRRVDVLFGTGGGNFGAATSFAMPFNEKPSGMAAADLDGDGDIDLATTIEVNGAGRFVVMANNGGAFTSTSFVSNSLNPGAVIAADLDLDGDYDLAAADETSNVVSAAPNLGALQFGAAVTFAVGTRPTAIAGGDLDGNGSTDLATANQDSDNASVLLNSQAGGPLPYCTSGISTNGCMATISANFDPRVGNGTPCVVTVSALDGQRAGIVFYGVNSFIQPWCTSGGGSSFLCVKSPTARTAAQNSGGTAGSCNGMLVLNWSAFQLANPSALGNPWLAGDQAFVQGWYRDPASCKTTSLSNALVLTYLP